MIHSLIIWFNAVVGRHNDLKAVLPENLKLVTQLKLPLYLFLVIPSAPDAMNDQLNNAFRKSLRLCIGSA